MPVSNYKKHKRSILEVWNSAMTTGVPDIWDTRDGSDLLSLIHGKLSSTQLALLARAISCAHTLGIRQARLDLKRAAAIALGGQECTPHKCSKGYKCDIHAEGSQHVNTAQSAQDLSIIAEPEDYPDEQEDVCKTKPE